MLKKFLTTEKNKEILAYLFFGILTTAINWLICLLPHYILSMSVTITNAVAWFVSVLFAYATNKPFVFKSSNTSFKVVLTEAVKFFASRLFTGVLETVILRLTVEHLGWNAVLWKAIASVLVVVLYYIFSKFFVFKKEK